MKVLLTGATGKVGRHFIPGFLNKFKTGSIRAFCHNRLIPESSRLEIFQGDIASRPSVIESMKGVTHVIHMSTSKESPDTIMDVAIKGLFWLLEECRTSPVFKQFILIGGDASIGHFFYKKDKPVTELSPRTPYPGCYALSKAMEEDMLEYYFLQYGLNGCCLRAPWVMEKDDFKFSLSFGEDQFGGPLWREIVGLEKAQAYHKKNTIPVMLDAEGKPMRRNFIHVSDLVDAILTAIDHPNAYQQLFNIGMAEPVDYRSVASYLGKIKGYPNVEVPTNYYSTWYDISKARHLLEWQPEYDLYRLIDEAYSYKRHPNEVRKVWYPG